MLLGTILILYSVNNHLSNKYSLILCLKIKLFILFIILINNYFSTANYYLI